MAEPHFGTTRSGHDVHLRTSDHHPASSRYQRFNKRLALVMTANIGTMTAFWVFWGLCFTILPSVLHAMGVGSLPLVPRIMLSFGFNLLGTWLFSTCFQLTLLPALMVGQNLQNEAADARAAKTFEDVEALATAQAADHVLLRAVADHLGVVVPEAAASSAGA